MPGWSEGVGTSSSHEEITLQRLTKATSSSSVAVEKIVFKYVFYLLLFLQ